MTPPRAAERKCHECDQVATRAYCYPAEPWTPYCPEHPPQYGTAGDIPIEQLPRALKVLRAVLKGLYK